MYHQLFEAHCLLHCVMDEPFFRAVPYFLRIDTLLETTYHVLKVGQRSQG